MSSDDARLRKLKFRAWRRGFREADLILGPFADKYVATFSPDELDVFEALLEVPDTDLYQWIVGQAPTPPEWDGAIMSQLKVFREEVYKTVSRGDAG